MPITPSIDIRRAVPADALPLASFACAAFEEAFAADNTAGNMASYTGSAFGEAVQRREIENARIDTLLALTDGAIAGYAQLWWAAPPAFVPGDAPAEVRRLYVGSAWHGTGLAGRLMAAAAAAASERRADVVWLGVWEHNVRARRFYEKLGFEFVGTQSFMLGTDRQTDQVLAVTLGALSDALGAASAGPAA